MSIVRHSNPFPDIWATFVTWNAERKRIANLPDAERRAHKTAKKAAAYHDKNTYKELHYPKGWYWRRLKEDLREIWERGASNIWGIVRRATFIRIVLLGMLIDILTGPVGLIFYIVGIWLHLLFYSEIACDGTIESSVRRNTRLLGGVVLLLPVILLAIMAPATHSLIIVLSPVLVGWLAPVSYRGKWNRATKTTTQKNEWISVGVTILDLGLFALFMIAAAIQSGNSERVSFKDINWRLCNPYSWEQNSITPSKLHTALRRDDDLGTCLAGHDLLWEATPLHFAVWFGDNAQHLPALINHGADINARRGDGSTPLHDAAMRSFDPDSYISLLLDLGANPTIRNAKSQMAIDLAMGNEAVSDTIISQLYDAGDKTGDNLDEDAHGR